MLKKTFLVVVTGLLCFGASAFAQNRGPSTPEERKRAVEMATFLETTPLAKEAKDYRKALLFFLVEVPDISIKLCTNVLGDSKQFTGDYKSELVGQLMYSQAKFIIENPEKAHDDTAVYVAGVEGVLRTWKAVKAAKPKAKFPLLDELQQKQEAGSLADYVRTAQVGCK